MSQIQQAMEVDEIFEVLSNRRRRFVVHILKQENEPTEIGHMATKIAAWENGIPLREVTGKLRKSVYTALRQTHLPMMDEVGLVAFNKNRGTVKPTEILNELDVYLDIVYGRDIPWSMYYLGLGILAAITSAGVHVGAWPFSVEPIAWSAAFVAMLIFSAVTHMWHNRKTKIGVGESPPEHDFSTQQDSTNRK